ncbi:twin-arginine translocase TatA/TatE family subunit [Halorussus aquaticus]|uniref:Twin-arginine translocase TatA/TatE family subunit n=1 Tax=Halorussus aquaticus TaxID=2953748 RepID=A0ABD5Q7E2_9EURY|nr:twin-arginine translocase TatA/TatE family subunit [Halorussus aquaticus]
MLGCMSGGPRLLIVFAVAVLLFCANKIPELTRSMGRDIGEFQKDARKPRTVKIHD